MIQAKFGLNWPSGFRGEDFWKSLQTDDRRRTPSDGNSSHRWANYIDIIPSSKIWILLGLYYYFYKPDRMIWRTVVILMIGCLCLVVSDPCVIHVVLYNPWLLHAPVSYHIHVTETNQLYYYWMRWTFVLMLFILCSELVEGGQWLSSIPSKRTTTFPSNNWTQKRLWRQKSKSWLWTGTKMWQG